MTRSSEDTKTRTLRAGEWLSADIGATGPVPSGFRLTDTRFVSRLRPMDHIGLATFRADCIVSRETEYGQYGQKEL
ncbi:hypothetical protein [Phyllobacterium bourgognense]|uniref:Uncharacterized protein n=1 Tax=Phyllobacterium bourgognense TaxID=314236 RepID=A0A368Z2T8_9HYPH|nr:hypothetical protein [Phyllobacterium bourgognense]RCW86269.1 hypothetical protein C7476_102249 [Phyllobacterium bourgognense]